ncbi:hypothetical protein AB0O07_19005 [Streptomyces sp. NPDC093085]|uniref:hypothetical protein n=1 Tax=Streptomyces sp. NPDC093085 TaxID=3155068 RepID=UPI00341A0E1C
MSSHLFGPGLRAGLRAGFGAATVAGASLLYGATCAAAAPAPAPAPAPAGNVGLIVVDNSDADSWLEVDRTLNTLIGSKGTAGSDHDGGGGAIDVQAGESSGATPGLLGWIPQIGHPPWQGDDGGGD